MRKTSIVLSILLCAWGATPAAAQVNFSVRTPTVSIGIHVPLYPQLVRVPGYPVYYAPELDSNYFFYDGVYWIYYDDNWYASSWYDGPWELVDPDFVPLYILRVPVRYYRVQPVYFRGWIVDASPRWGEHWGNRWENRHSGWDRWNRRSAPAPAPLPSYQRQYSGDRYPRAEQQHRLRNRHYNYQPRDTLVRQSFPAQRVQPAPATPATRDRRQPKDQALEQTRELQQRDQQQRNQQQRERNTPAQPDERGRQRAQPLPTQAAPVQQQRQEREQPTRQRETPPNSDNRERQSHDNENDKQPKREQKPKKENAREQDRQQDRK